MHINAVDNIAVKLIGYQFLMSSDKKNANIIKHIINDANKISDFI